MMILMITYIETAAVTDFGVIRRFSSDMDEWVRGCEGPLQTRQKSEAYLQSSKGYQSAKWGRISRAKIAVNFELCIYIYIFIFHAPQGGDI